MALIRKADVQAGLRLCCLQTSEDRFSRLEAHLMSCFICCHLQNIPLNALVNSSYGFN